MENRTFDEWLPIIGSCYLIGSNQTLNSNQIGGRKVLAKTNLKDEQLFFEWHYETTSGFAIQFIKIP